MKVGLYAALRRNGAMDWWVTLDFRVDQAYWFLDRREVGALLRIEKEFPLHRALAMRDEWNRTIRKIDDIDKLPYPREIVKHFGNEKLDLCKQRVSELVNRLRGRALLFEEAQSLADSMEDADVKVRLRQYLQIAHLSGAVDYLNGIESVPRGKRSWLGSTVQCRRCGDSGVHIRYSECSSCGERCAYCEACLTMGRVKTCSLLVCGIQETAPGSATMPRRISDWGLSDAQKDAVVKALGFLESDPRKEFLLWAVTGAGKTEMVFPIIEREACAGRRVCIATPRRDVVLELEPRIRRAFPGLEVAALYGGSGDKFGSANVVLATTHQLYRFRHAFDLMIIDELDAFPYHNNPALQSAAAKACLPSGKLVYLSATPPTSMIRRAAWNRIGMAKVPVRYHRRPLPVPRLVQMRAIEKWRGGLPRRVMEQIERSIGRKASTFVFVPLISQIEGVESSIRNAFPSLRVRGASSRHDDRSETVALFRERKLDVLVTTTILERGVTIPRSDVYVLDADSSVFDRSSLVQMAGRAGRSSEDPEGIVCFFAAKRNRQQLAAVKEIRAMNRLAMKQGYLLSS